MTQSPIRRVTIGRRPDLCDIVVPHNGVSGRHCALGFDTATGRWQVHDLDSRNGTWVILEGRAFRVVPGRPMDVADGVMLRLGPAAAVRVTDALVDPVVRPRAFKGPRTVDGQGRGDLAGQAVERYTLAPVSSQAISDLLASTERVAGLSVACRGLRVRLDEPLAPGLPVELLPGIDLVIRSGELVGVGGAPDAFTEALLETLCGQRAPLAGTVRVGGHPVVARPDGFAPWVVRVAPDDVPPGHLTVREVLLQRARDVLGDQLAPPVLEARVLQVAQRLDLMAELDAVIAARGTLVDADVLRRVQIGEALMGDPAVLLLRSPLIGLDGPAAESLIEVLRGIADDGTTVVLSLDEPPSRDVFERLDRLLLTFQGVTAWYGPAWPASVRWMQDPAGLQQPRDPGEAWAPLRQAHQKALASGEPATAASSEALAFARRFVESPWYRDAQAGEEAVRLPGMGTPPELPLPPEPPSVAAPSAPPAGPRVTRTTRLGAVPVNLAPPAPAAPEVTLTPGEEPPRRTGTQEFLILDRGVPDEIALEWFAQAAQGLRPLPPPPTIQRPPTLRSAPGRLSGGVTGAGLTGLSDVGDARPTALREGAPTEERRRPIGLLIAVALLVAMVIALAAALVVSAGRGGLPSISPVAASPPPGMVLVQPGHVALAPDGSVSRWRASDAHRVTVSHGLFVDITPVTRVSYDALVGFGGSEDVRACADCPAAGVNWFEALRYANARSESEGLAACYALEDCGVRRVGLAAAVAWQCARVRLTGPPDAPLACEGYRLPTEAEWVHLAGYEHGEAAENGSAHPVGRGRPNLHGVQDVGTLVGEWTVDAYTPILTAGTFENRLRHAPDGVAAPRVVRGGQEGAGGANGRAAGVPTERSAGVGLRMVRTVTAGAQ